MYRGLAAATLSLSLLAPPAYAQAITPPLEQGSQANLETQLQQYLAPVQGVFKVDLRAAYEKARDLLGSSKGNKAPNPHPIILHDPIEELMREDEAPPVLLDAIETHLNSLAQFRAQRIADNPHLEPVLSRYDPSKGMVSAFDFGSDVRNIQYTTNARLGDPLTGRATDALLAYFEFHPGGQENDLQYRVLVPIDQVSRIRTEEYDYFERSYNKVVGLIQVKRKSEPDTMWKVLDNPNLERMKNDPKRKNTKDHRMPDASQRSPSTLSGQQPPGIRP